jgi:hypothetical protein
VPQAPVQAQEEVAQAFGVEQAERGFLHLDEIQDPAPAAELLVHFPGGVEEQD